MAEERSPHNPFTASFKARIAIAVLILLLLTAGGGGAYAVFLYTAEKDASATLAGDLDAQKRENETLRDTLQQRTEEIEVLQEQLQELLETQEQLQEQLEEMQEQVRSLQEQVRSLRAAREAAARTTPASNGIAYLTIDDGPSANTIRILNILAAHNVRATFFVTGNNSSGDPQIYRRIVNEGHALGNHTYSHHYQSIYRSPEAFMADLQRLEEVLVKVAGVRPKIIRFPGGTSNTVAPAGMIPQVIATVTAAGYDYFDWNVGFGDAAGINSPDLMVQTVINQVAALKGGSAVILLHDGAGNYNTTLALPRVIEALQARGYRFAVLEKGCIQMKHR